MNLLKILKFLGEFIVHVVVTIVVVYFLFTWLNAVPTYNPNKIVDPVSLANTFMVFVTFIIVIATVAISIGAVFYTKQYSQTKEQLLSDNLDDVIKAIVKKDKLREDFITSFFNDPIIRKEIDKRIDNFESNINEKIKLLNQNIDSSDKELKEYIKKEILALENRLATNSTDDEVAGESIKDMFKTLSDEGVKDGKA